MPLINLVIAHSFFTSRAVVKLRKKSDSSYDLCMKYHLSLFFLSEQQLSESALSGRRCFSWTFLRQSALLLSRRWRVGGIRRSMVRIETRVCGLSFEWAQESSDLVQENAQNSLNQVSTWLIETATPIISSHPFRIDNIKQLIISIFL